ncbi:hypothetical protein EDO6_05261 [Paenibacillus xylanexedens]|nr:hypothetical protein EDO6_05261 [Paenibacillus xylanexedens]
MPNPVLPFRFPHLHENLPILVVPPLNMCCTPFFVLLFREIVAQNTNHMSTKFTS